MDTRNPFYDIIQEPIFTESGLPINKVALINDETKDVVGIVSPNYEVVANKQVADLFDEAFAGMKIKSSTDHMDATTKRWKRVIRLDMDKFTFDITGVGDITQIQVEIFNGYDGRTSYGFDISAYRLVCTNGMVAKDRDLLSEHYTHFSNNSELLLQSFQAKFQNFGSTIQTWLRWAKEPYTQLDFKRFVGSQGFITEKMGDFLMANYETAMNTYKEKETKWAAFNALTYAATHNTKARKGSNLFSNRFSFLTKTATKFYENDGVGRLALTA